MSRFRRAPDVCAAEACASTARAGSAADQVTVHEASRSRALARTLLDLADVLADQDLERAIHESEYLRLFDLTALIAVVDANPGRRGAKLLEPPRAHRK